MIHKIYSDLPTFKNLDFNSGLNVLLVDKCPESTNQQTRNRAGKTSLIEIINFLLGADCEKNSIFTDEELIDYSFNMVFDIGATPVCVKRSGGNPKEVSVTLGVEDKRIQQLLVDARHYDGVISNDNWKTLLGHLIFELRDIKGNKQKKTYEPSFRSLISYFVRRRNSGGFIYPTRQSEDQGLWDQQVAVSYLLGIDWSISQEWQKVRESEKSLKSIKKEMTQEEGVLNDFIGKAAKLRTDLAVKVKQVDDLSAEIAAFRVHPKYNELEKEASELTRKINDQSGSNIQDRILIEELERAVKLETPPSLDKIEKLYSDFGILFPEQVSKRFTELEAFHKSVVENRVSYLSQEIEEAKERIAQRSKNMKTCSERQSEIMKILGSHGALDQYNRIQTELSKLVSEREDLKKRFELAQTLESQRIILKNERSSLEVRLNNNFVEQKKEIDIAISYYQEISKSLYEDAGQLVVDATSNGPTFSFPIQGERSAGIQLMRIFCFDMMLMKICKGRSISPNFLVHDSHLFDGVDERQTASALMQGARFAGENGFQYLVTMNSDAIPKQGFSEEFDINKFRLPTKLTDAKDGGLFGIKFG
ncbi:MAG: ABC-three component system protein [Candidatus Altiarchaeia archaeon]